MRFVPILIAATCLALPAGATKPTPETPPSAPGNQALAGAPLVVQENTYRFGDLLRSEPASSVDACAEACHLDARCVAWSMTPAVYSVEGRCELKSNPGAASYRPGAVSGISESVRMEPEMRYQVRVPEGYQPEPEVVEELLGAEAPTPIHMPDLLGATETRVSAVMKAPVAPAPPAAPAAPVETIEPVEMARVAPPLPAPPVAAPPLPAPPTEPVTRIADTPPAPTKAAAPISFRLTPLKPTPGALQLLAPAPSEKAEAFTAQAASDAGS
jgi:hypothetical protein